ncbi:UDP-glucosyltransferase 2 [Hyalella azteca]|uniref:UDP-glucosyltransferase 2 n=1 Tax=Hyalella azteca TaxID=294128 RepID=A0A8B7P293_HYAAZ|nr:UDP-glucosyltransferase 2 [Hyalella azteca]
MRNHFALFLLLLAASISVSTRTDLYFNSSLPAPQQHFKFLFLLPTVLPSHTWAVAPLAVALAYRGHEVHMLCENPDIYQLPNVTCIDLGFKFDEPEQQPRYYEGVSVLTEIKKMFRAYNNVSYQLLTSPRVLNLYDNRKKFDFIVAEDLTLIVLYPLLHEMPYALYSTIGLNPFQSAVAGNVQNPLTVADGWSYNFPDSFSFLDRIKNLMTNCILYIFAWSAFHSAEITATVHLPEAPSMTEIERNVSIHFVSTILALDGPMPLLPNQIPVGGIILRPLPDLPPELAEFLRGEEPVVYVSFGLSTLKDDSIPRQLKDIMFSVFAKLPYKVIVKISNQKTRRSSNVLYVDSVPQQSILAHPNVKVFVCHFGLSGTTEALQNGVPIVGLPAIYDQLRTAKLLVKHGVAIQLSWATLEENVLKDAIEEVMHNPSYRRKMGDLSRIFRDQLVSPLDTAVYWTEYAARHQGAPHLQSPAKSLSFIKLFGLDILALVIFGSLISYMIMKKTYSTLGMCTGRNRKLSKQKSC